MKAFRVPETGVFAVNQRGELALIIEPVAAALQPTRVTREGNRFAVLAGDFPVSVRGYADRALDAAVRKGSVLVLEIDEASETVVRESFVPMAAA